MLLNKYKLKIEEIKFIFTLNKMIYKTSNGTNKSDKNNKKRD